MGLTIAKLQGGVKHGLIISEPGQPNLNKSEIWAGLFKFEFELRLVMNLKSG